LALAVVFVIWSFVPMIGPLIGIQRTPDEIIEFITRHNLVLLVNPAPVIKNGNGSYHDWAFAEFEGRRKAGVALWIAGSVLLGLWAARSKRMKGIDICTRVGRTEETVAGKDPGEHAVGRYTSLVSQKGLHLPRPRRRHDASRGAHGAGP